MNAALNLELMADTLEMAVKGLRTYRSLIRKILGNSPDEVKDMLQVMEGLTLAQIRDALEIYKG